MPSNSELLKSLGIKPKERSKKAKTDMPLPDEIQKSMDGIYGLDELVKTLNIFYQAEKLRMQREKTLKLLINQRICYKRKQRFWYIDSCNRCCICVK